MIFSLKTRRLLGVHLVGEGATERVHIGQAVLNLKGTVEYFVENTFNYPTLAEAYKIAGWVRGIGWGDQGGVRGRIKRARRVTNPGQAVFDRRGSPATRPRQ